VLRKEIVHNALLRQNVPYYPIFMSATPQYLEKAFAYHQYQGGVIAENSWQYCVDLGLDVIQVGHGSFYPVKILELPTGTKYQDEFQRTHIIGDYFDDFCAPFPLLETKHMDIEELVNKWKTYEFPNPQQPSFLESLQKIKPLNETLSDPLSVWGVINGPLEPTWQLLSDGWPAFFILLRRNPELAKEILARVTDYCIAAGQAMIQNGCDAIRIGDDYAINEGPYCSTAVWEDAIYPEHRRLIAGLKEVGGKDFPVILHSDGKLTPLLELLAKGGIDSLNPIQPDALDFQEVVNVVGNDLSFAGVFDLRYFLEPYSTELHEKMQNEVQRIFSIMENFNSYRESMFDSPGKTGLCIAPTHQIQPGSYVESFESWVKIVQEMNKQLMDTE
jgi:uroporphyrinogen-III decarboxylase